MGQNGSSNQQHASDQRQSDNGTPPIPPHRPLPYLRPCDRWLRSTGLRRRRRRLRRLLHWSFRAFLVDSENRVLGCDRDQDFIRCSFWYDISFRS